MNTISADKRILLDRLFCEGKSTREAARIAGVAKHTANVYRMLNGGAEAYRKRGAKFKKSRWPVK